MNKEKFAIFSPVSGLQKNIPIILTLTPDNINVLLKDGKILRRRMREATLLNDDGVKAQTPDANPIIHYHQFVRRSDGTEYLLAFTKRHIYHWNPDTKAFDLKFTCSDDCENWETASYNDKVIATNNVDKVLGWDTTGNFVALDDVDNGIEYSRSYSNETNVNGDSDEGQPVLLVASTSGYDDGDKVIINRGGDREEEGIIKEDGITENVSIEFVENLTYDHSAVQEDKVEKCTSYYLTKAKHLTVYENYLILGNTYENEIYHYQRARWNSIGEEANWLTGSKGSMEVGQSDKITGFGHYQGFLIIFKENSHFKVWLVGFPYIFNKMQLSTEIGCKCSHSIINDSKGRLYFYSSEMTFKEISAGTISDDIQTDIIAKIQPAYIHLIKSTFLNETEEILWSIPVESDSNNKVVSFKEGKWLILGLSISAFGEFREM